MTQRFTITVLVEVEPDVDNERLIITRGAVVDALTDRNVEEDVDRHLQVYGGIAAKRVRITER